jgi:uncharacterized membrane protein
MSVIVVTFWLVTGLLWHNDKMFYSLEFSFWYVLYGSVLTYLVWGFVVSFEVNLAMGGSRLAREWIIKRHTYKQLSQEVKVFYPLILIGYFFLELLPHVLWNAPKSDFDMPRLFDELFGKGEK